jgi:hypothetical protein
MEWTMARPMKMVWATASESVMEEREHWFPGSLLVGSWTALEAQLMDDLSVNLELEPGVGMTVTWR